jgi:transposase
MVTTRHRKKYSPEFREEAVRMVLDSSRPIAHVARDLDLKEGTLGNWGVPRTQEEAACR